MSFEVEITLNGKRETLKTSLRAARAINSTVGGFLSVAKKIEDYDQSVCATVIAAALERKPAEIEEQIFADDSMRELVIPVSLFVYSLARGGRDPNAKIEDTLTVGEQ